MLGRLGQDIKAQRAQKVTDCVGLIPAKQLAPRLSRRFTEADDRFQSLVQAICVITDFFCTLPSLLSAFGGRFRSPETILGRKNWGSVCFGTSYSCHDTDCF